MRVVVEPAARGERGVERLFARMAEWRMTDVMRQAKRFGEVLVEAQRPRQHAPDLRHFQAVSKADAEMVAVGA